MNQTKISYIIVTSLICFFTFILGLLVDTNFYIHVENGKPTFQKLYSRSDIIALENDFEKSIKREEPRLVSTSTATSTTLPVQVKENLCSQIKSSVDQRKKGLIQIEEYYKAKCQ